MVSVKNRTRCTAEDVESQVSDSYEDYYQPRFTDSTPSVAALQARIAELEAQLNPAKWDGRLALLPNYLKRVQMTVDFDAMTLRYSLDDDLVQPWQFTVLHDDVLVPMFGSVGLKLVWSPERDTVDMVEL